MRRRMAIVVAAAAAVATLGATPWAEAAGSRPTGAAGIDRESNGCVIVYPLKLAICIPRL